MLIYSLAEQLTKLRVAGPGEQVLSPCSCHTKALGGPLLSSTLRPARHHFKDQKPTSLWLVGKKEINEWGWVFFSGSKIGCDFHGRMGWFWALEREVSTPPSWSMR